MEPFSVVLINLLVFVFGLLIGNRMAIGRDRRRELNEAARPIRRWLLAEVDGPSAYRTRPTQIEVDTFIGCLPAWRRRGFRKAYERQEARRALARIQNPYGEVSYGDDDLLRASLRKCLRYTRRQ